ncbi:Pycsar system effector family protein [Vagococcus fluvialis]|uniref:Pycsar system effector family protein n=1 Tax=Vagococcus fluvialis TaxID=2738 RepID=UPI003B5C9E33
MESKKKDFVYAQNDYLNSYIQFADTKSAVFITVNGVLIGFLYAQFKKLLPLNLLESKQIVLSFSIILLLISYIFLFLVIFPRRKYRNGNSIVFWEDVSKHKDVSSYKLIVSSIKGDEFEEIMVEQNYYLSKTASQKYKHLHFSFIFSIASYFVLIIFCILTLL